MVYMRTLDVLLTVELEFKAIKKNDAHKARPRLKQQGYHLTNA